MGTDIRTVSGGLRLRGSRRLVGIGRFRALELWEQVQFIHEVDDPSAAFDTLIQLEMEVRCELHHDSPGEQELQVRTASVEL